MASSYTRPDDAASRLVSVACSRLLAHYAKDAGPRPAVRNETAVKDRVFRPTLDGSPSSGPSSWFAIPTDDPKALARQIRDATAEDIRDHFARGDFETWLRDLYRRPDLADRVRRMRERWNGGSVPRLELISLLEPLR